MPVPPGRAGGIPACALLVWLAHPLDAQRDKAPAPLAGDPYTGGAPEKLELLGYESFGPFLFGSAASDVVQSHLGDVPILWVETAHFRLGSALAEIQPEEPDEIDELKLELDRLRRRLPALPAKPKKLDPWLRLHLFARRLEDLYEDFCKRLGVSPPSEGAQDSGTPGAAVMLPSKFGVLLAQKESTLARFTNEYCGLERIDSAFYRFTGSFFFFGVSAEAVALTDSDLHYVVVYGVVQNLLTGINGYKHSLPAWWQNGVALWFARDREPRILLYVQPGREILVPEELADWEPLVRGRVENRDCLEWSEMLARQSWIDQPFGDNVVLWSRIDYLLRRAEVASTLVSGFHEPSPAKPNSAAVLQFATGTDLGGLDAAWRDWVKQTYRKKRR